MDALINWADDEGCVLSLYVSQYGYGQRMTNVELEEFYAGYGFRRLPRENPKDDRFMRRHPIA